MGMVWVARLADDAETRRVMADPDSAYDFINPEDGYDDDAVVAYLDKEWHGVHHLLTGTAGATNSPLSLIIGEFEEVGEDNGYGPAWYVPGERLRAFQEALAALDEAALRKRFDPDAMVAEQVYLADAYQREGEAGFGFLLERVNQLRAFAANAVASGNGAFVVIT